MEITEEYQGPRDTRKFPGQVHWVQGGDGILKIAEIPSEPPEPTIGRILP